MTEAAQAAPAIPDDARPDAAMANKRYRLGVALIIDSPVAEEINGLRRAAGDGALDRIAPHITLVPPVNVAASRLNDALGRLRSAAATREEPLHLTLGPPASFLPANPVLILEVGGDVDGLRALRDAVFVEPLKRTLSWPWIPHVTLADVGDPARIEAAVAVLDGYLVTVELDRLVLLEADRSDGSLRWRPLADTALGVRRVVGRGGLDLELTRGRILDPRAMEVIEAIGGVAALPRPLVDGSGAVVTARRAGDVAGVAAAWRDDDGGHVAVGVALRSRGEGIGGHLLAHVEAAVADAGWGCTLLDAIGPAGFYRSRSRWSVE
ncbi:MAG: 2'-5' RNA ligase family protein [Actinomycetota bacterium]|nr:2'-5' RNA ligase family protein [Actinomycetota bacterium]